jgi:hypothetical protein
LKRAISFDEAWGEKHEAAPWVPRAGRHWTPEQREAQRKRMLASRLWEIAAQVAERHFVHLDLAAAIARFLPHDSEPPPLRGVPFAFSTRHVVHTSRVRARESSGCTTAAAVALRAASSGGVDFIPVASSDAPRSASCCSATTLGAFRPALIGQE